MNDTFLDIKGTAVIADDLLVYGEGDDLAASTSDMTRTRELSLKELEREISP